MLGIRREPDLYKDPKQWIELNLDATPNWLTRRPFTSAEDRGFTNQVGIDASFNRPPVSEMKRVGYEWFVGYTSMVPSKNVPKAYVDACVAAGIRVVLVGQDGKSDPLGGYSRGVERAREYFRQARALGYPEWAVHFFATDFEPTSAQLRGPVADFYHGVSVVAASEGREVGNYGSDVVCNYLKNQGLVRWCWQTKAWSYGRISPYANFIQYAGHAGLRPRMSSGLWDENLLLKPWPRMGDPKPSAPAPAPTYGTLNAPIVGAALDYSG